MIIYLNGPSSSGKSSIAAALVDLPGTALRHVIRDDDQYDAHQRLAELHDTGKDLVFETVEYLPLMQAGIAWLKESQVVLVGVFCSVAELERRERQRGDRPVGIAKSQAAQVPSSRIYDLCVDTTETAPEECASRITGFLDSGTRCTAYARLPAVQYDSLSYNDAFGGHPDTDKEAAFLADALARYVAKETPETIAKVLINLDTTLPIILNRLSVRVQGEVLYHLLRLQDAGMGLMGQMMDRVGGLDGVCEILNRTGGLAERRVLDYLDGQNPYLAEAVRNRIISLNNIAHLPDDQLTEVMGRIERGVLAMALRGADPQVRDRLLSCTTASVRQAIQGDTARMCPVRKADVEAAQLSIVKTAGRLEVEGKIMIHRGEGEFLL